MSAPAVSKRYFTLAEAAEYLCKSQTSMRACTRTTDPVEFIPSIRDGRLIKFDVVDLDAYMGRKKES